MPIGVEKGGEAGVSGRAIFAGEGGGGGVWERDEFGEGRQTLGQEGGFGRGFGNRGLNDRPTVRETKAGIDFAEGGFRLTTGGAFEQLAALGIGEGVGLFEGESEGEIGEPVALQDRADAAMGGRRILRSQRHKGLALHSIAPRGGAQFRRTIKGHVGL